MTDNVGEDGEEWEEWKSRNVSSSRRLKLFAEIENVRVAWEAKNEFLLWMY